MTNYSALMKTYSASAQNLVKVAATKTADGHVWCAPRMPGGAFHALVDAGWVERHNTEPRGHYYAITAKGQAVLDAYKPEDVFASTHGQKALETFRRLDTNPADWFHPAIRWVEEERMMLVSVDCPDCRGDKWVRHDAEGNVIPMPKTIPYGKEGHYEAERAVREYHRAAQAESKHQFGNCGRCRSHKRGYTISTGRVMDYRLCKVMVGYPVWPKGTKFQARFGHRGHSAAQCALCGKGIPSGNLVPVAHDKNGNHQGMWVGEDCARKFLKVAALKPGQDLNKKNLEYVLNDNYRGPPAK